jgi:hypothetical protein
MSTVNASAEAVARDVDLDRRIALAAGGFRWVVWSVGRVGDRSWESKGRFLARPDDRMAGWQVPALGNEPLAPEPLRHVPWYSSEVGAALDAAAECGLFSVGSAALAMDPEGLWVVKSPSLPRAVKHVEAAVAICLAILAWIEVKGAS